VLDLPGRAPADRAFGPKPTIASELIRTGAAWMIQLGDLMMILDLHRQGLSIAAIARRTGRDPKTVRKYIECGLDPPAYGPRQVGRPGKLAPYLGYLRERIAAFPQLTATRLTREIRERDYTGAYTAVKRFVAAIRPCARRSTLRSRRCARTMPISTKTASRFGRRRKSLFRHAGTRHGPHPGRPSA
jgi:hypothetical protein